MRVQLAGTNYLSLTEVQILGPTAPVNVALSKTATQSSTHSSGAVAGRAVDGNTSGVFANGSVTHTNSDLNAWWQVDLGQIEAIGTIKVWNRVEFPERLTSFYVFVSDQPFTSTNLTATQNQAGVSSYYTSGQGGFPTELAIYRSGRYVRVQLAGTNYLSLAEVQVFTGPSSPPVQWLISDHLGTPRMLFDHTGNLNSMKRHDYLPFGEELFAPTGGRSAAQGYSGGDGVRQQFTSKERDLETGLDYFLKRYYSNVQGRFTSPDVVFADQWEAEPQSWNLYTYVGNSPTNTIDPFGLWKKVDCNNGGNCWEAEEDDTWASLAIDAGLGGLPAETGAYLEAYFQYLAIVPGVTVVDVSLFLAWKQDLDAKQDLRIRFSVPIEVDFGGGGGLRNITKAASKSGLISRLSRWLGLGKKAGEATQEAIRAGRKAYEADVRALTTKVAEMRAAGHSIEAIAIEIHGHRRALGVKYKDVTPPELLNTILERNIRVYGDAFGPTIE